jgi:hypothetical protein
MDSSTVQVDNPTRGWNLLIGKVPDLLKWKPYDSMLFELLTACTAYFIVNVGVYVVGTRISIFKQLTSRAQGLRHICKPETVPLFVLVDFQMRTESHNHNFRGLAEKMKTKWKLSHA